QLHDLRNHTLANASAKRAGEKIDATWLETVNMLKVAELVIAAALQRRESRGSHWRLDFNTHDDTLTGCHYVFQPANIAALQSYRCRGESGLVWGGDPCGKK